MSEPLRVAVIGAGLAGTEAALVLARRGVPVDLHEMRPGHMTPAHQTGLPAELVCSNSLKSQELHSAHGVLKAELTLLGSPLLEIARRCALPAGSALAVDRRKFSMAAAEELSALRELITLVSGKIESPPPGYGACIIAAGPLIADRLALWLRNQCRAEALHFYDAIAPIVSADSVDPAIAFFAVRHDPEKTDYLNCPFTREEYHCFYTALMEADRTHAHSFEKAQFFEACLPIEVLAERGEKVLSFGPLKPIGLIDPRSGRRPYAVCQLRRENDEGSCYNLVGFQTRLTIPEQRRIFRMIPGLQNAEFLRYGSIHRNTYVDSPEVLAGDFSLRRGEGAMPTFLAGQLCGSEGYTESIATGHLAALFAHARITGTTLLPLPRETALGSLLHHVTASPNRPFTPSNIHFGLLPPMPDNGKRIKKKANRELLCERALACMAGWAATVRRVLA